MELYPLMASFFFGTIGLGMFMYGKRASRVVPLGAGLALMVVPYFLTNVIAMTVVCGGLSLAPWFIRE